MGLNLQNAKDVLSDYFSVTLPDKILREFLAGETELLKEIEDGGISDTCQRSLLIDLILTKLNLRSWPTYGDGDIIYREFLKELKVKLISIGGQLE
jgi:hypothetical protein